MKTFQRRLGLWSVEYVPLLFFRCVSQLIKGMGILQEVCFKALDSGSSDLVSEMMEWRLSVFLFHLCPLRNFLYMPEGIQTYHWKLDKSPQMQRSHEKELTVWVPLSNNMKRSSIAVWGDWLKEVELIWELLTQVSVLGRFTTLYSSIGFSLNTLFPWWYFSSNSINLVGPLTFIIYLK